MDYEEIASHEYTVLYTADQINAELAQLGDDFFNQFFEGNYKF